MLTRLHVRGFKNLLDLEVRFGPFTCIAGLNAAGKSNLFDAISFLHQLAQKPIMDAVQSLRATTGRSSVAADIFTTFEGFRSEEMRFTADMIVNRDVVDDFGVPAQAAISTLRYEVAFRRSSDDSEIVELASESLVPIRQGDATKALAFPRTPEFIQSVIGGKRTVEFISTAGEVVTVHQEGHGGRKLPAPKSTRTALGGLASSDFPSILAANREMLSWQSLMLEPSAMRAPSQYRDPRLVDSRGANLANAIYRLAKQGDSNGRVYAELANKVSKLIDDVREIRIVEQDRTETRTLEVCGRDGIFHPARSLSDGTLRFLVLTVLDLDPEVRGMICLEEPENGIHPERIGTIVQLLKDIAVDPEYGVDSDNPLRQIVINTHSPLVVQHVSRHDLIYMEREQIRRDGSKGLVATTFVPEGSWRAKQVDHPPRLAPGHMVAYLGDAKADEPDHLWTNWLKAERDSQ